MAYAEVIIPTTRMITIIRMMTPSMIGDPFMMTQWLACIGWLSLTHAPKP